ncbi:hypothetical protein DICVIV_12813 [Dictyocaulus viviparus]|uniref:Uncharacterized protein n=1 Tax=Dictyocaulus viviparus TaxID=29172 RepID=A0A0D8XBV1_DICVI|nr:hypothetical protein DICVIV_12813 [Dictyocaulus viviparus]
MPSMHHIEYHRHCRRQNQLSSVAMHSDSDDGAVRRPAIVNRESANLHRSVSTVQFPSTYRERVEEQHTPAQFNSSAHNFTQHLRERSPSSSSALLNLLSRYPSAKQSVYSSTSSAAGLLASESDSAQRIYRSEGRPLNTHSYRAADASSGYSLEELFLQKPQQTPFKDSHHINTASLHHTQQSTLDDQSTHLPSETLLSLSVYNSDITYSPTYSHSSVGDINRNDTRRNVNGFPTQCFTANNSITKDLDNRSEHKFYTNLPNSNHHTLAARNKQWEELLDVTQLDSLLASVLEENMNRSTAEWSNTFAQVQNRFKNMPPETNESGLLYGFTSSGAPTLPRCGGTFTLPKSSSHNDIKKSESSIGAMPKRHPAEAPELRKSGAIDSFWSHTVNSRPLSPTVQRIPRNLTAAERLQILQDTHLSSGISARPGTGTQLAARREHYLHEASFASTYTPPHRETASRTCTSSAIFRGSSPNFSDLDNAVQELQCDARSISSANSAGRLGGCARFPTDDHAFSPPGGSVSRRFNSPSPTDSNSETSSVYQIPTGLPHPKPKHNIKEQLSNAGVSTYSFFRTGLRYSPNFPIPTTGSVASRINEFEKRPGTPILQIASAPRQDKGPVPNGPMSPKSTVFKSKPVIHVETGSRSPRNTSNAAAVFEFPPSKVRIDVILLVDRNGR